jgi:hypothetical protein
MSESVDWENKFKSLEKKMRKFGKRLNELENPDAPKVEKKLNPYMQFCKETRPVLREQFPEKSMTEISKLLGAEWRKIKNASVSPSPFADN